MTKIDQVLTKIDQVWPKFGQGHCFPLYPDWDQDLAQNNVP